MALDGLQSKLAGLFRTVRDARSAKVNFVRYADDFIITSSSKELLEEKVKPLEAGLVTRLTGDSVEVIASLDRPVELFIHDTVSEPDHMRAQLENLLPHLAPDAIIYASWFTQTFVDFCERYGLSYLEVADKPLNHWYRGSRYGLAWGMQALRATDGH